jgi:hypothetical protein
MTDRVLKIGQRVQCWGLFGGPYPGKILRKGKSKDCWLVRIRHENGKATTELHEDYIRERGT